MTEYKPVTVESVMTLADEFAKDAVVVVAIDSKHEKVHFTSWEGKASE